MKLEGMKIKAWAVINKNWKEHDWEDTLFESQLFVRGLDVYAYAIFNKRKDAIAFNNLGKRKEDKVVRVEIKIL